ncbi:MARVEL domain-containing protein 3 [Colossoma macropomum]|uniref:MARVEL domain-containing protein 3 n=1 Tax=Colossoma macropomum TaxID=42526 RepID=UPI001864D6BE|nr:MARVEL domain-containing protein 3 [Colossoma macropomum]XP_036443250.1 MARVEL domain-containing protein 3 [Colossoma macropomum]XP_036443251.1 MARVEL domain-containing protein 3 [Colossoma macropomum]
MPDHQSRNQNHRNHERRDWNRGREHQSDEKYREERSSGYDEERQRNPRDKQQRTYMHQKPPDSEDSYHHRHQEMYSDTSTYETPHREALYNLRYIPTSRGICQIMEFFLNMLIVICAGVPYSNKGQYKDIASLGGLYYYYYGGAQSFTAQEAVKVKQLDDLFYQVKLPPYIFSMACGGALMAYALAMLALGLFRVPYRWPPVLLAEALVDGLIGLGYIPAVAFYFIKLQETYSNAVCKEREDMYKSKGLKGSECSLNGTDIAGGIFGVLGAPLFLLSAVLAVRAFRAVRKLKQQKEAENGNL